MDTSSAAEKSDSLCSDAQTTNGDLSPTKEEAQKKRQADSGMDRTEDENTKDGLPGASNASDADNQSTMRAASGGDSCESVSDKKCSGSSSNDTFASRQMEQDSDHDDEDVRESKIPLSKHKRRHSNDSTTSSENSLDSSSGGKVNSDSASSSDKRQCSEDPLPGKSSPPGSPGLSTEDAASADSKNDSAKSASTGTSHSCDSGSSSGSKVDGATKNGSSDCATKDSAVQEKAKPTPKQQIVSDIKKPVKPEGVDARQSSSQGDKAFQSAATVLAAVRKPPITNFDPYIREMTDVEKEKLEREAGFPEFLKDVVKLGKYIPVKRQQNVDVTLRSGESLIECPSQVAPLLVKKPNAVLAQPPQKPEKSKGWGSDYFSSSSARLLMTVGFSRALEWYERDMVKIKDRQLKRNKDSKEAEEDLHTHRTSYLQAKHANEPFNAPLKKCQDCDFRTESEVVLEGHRLTPHLTSRREYKCSFCSFMTRDTKAIVFHMEAMHGKKGSVEPPRLFYECPFCPFETNLKTKATSHINKCQKYFFPGNNQAPVDANDFPGVTAKPVTLEEIRMYEMNFAAIANSNQIGGTSNNRLGLEQHRLPSGITLTRVPSSQNENQRFPGSLQSAGPRISNPPLLPLPNSGSRQKALPFVRTVRPATGGSLFQVVSSSGQVLPMLNSSALSQVAMLPPGTTVHAVSKAPQPVALFPNVAAVDAARPSQASTRSTVPSAAFASRHGPHTAPGQNSFVICEICDGYIKDLEQLRTHMQWIHKVKIHPKMLASRPPLNCQKCQWRFFTDQGLERHLLGAHGLVTSNMQDMVNSNQDGGRCTICGKVFACKLVAHMSQIHKITLKPAHLSYKCTVCSATFNLYRLFENHVYMVHSGAMKRPAGDDGSQAKKKVASSASTLSSSSASSSGAKPGAASKQSSSASSLSTAKTSEDTKEQPKQGQQEASSSSSDMKEDPKNGQKSLPETASKNGERPKHAEPPDKGRGSDSIGEEDSEESEEDECDGDNCKPKVVKIKPCAVKLCRIEKCEKCLFSFDGLVVLHTSDFGAEDDEDEEEEEEEAEEIVCEDDDDDEVKCLADEKETVFTSNNNKKKVENSDTHSDVKENDIVELEVIQEVNSRKNNHLKPKPLFAVNNIPDKVEELKQSNKVNEHKEENGRSIDNGEMDVEVIKEEIRTVIDLGGNKTEASKKYINNMVDNKLDKLGDDLPGMKVIDISHLDEGIEEIA